MENATKALLIAAAVLIAILIISFALIIYNMASETVGNVNLSEAEISQFNAKFTAYEGERISGAQINALTTTTLIHNQKELEDGTKRFVSVKAKDNILGEEGKEDLVSSEKTKKLPANNFYKVVIEYKDGLVRTINVYNIKK